MVSLDNDVAGALTPEIRHSGVSLEKAVNHYLRSGLIAANRAAREALTVMAFPLGLAPGLSYGNAELLESIEGERFGDRADGPTLSFMPPR